MISCVFAAIVGVLVLLADQFTKAYIATNFTLYETRRFIPKILDITYIHNTGGAWGMLSGYTWFLVIVTVVVMVICVAALIKFARESRLMLWAISLVLSGGLGNMIDRIFRGGKVVDFLHFEFMPDFPVFNIADCAIVIGAGLLILYFIMGIIKDMHSEKND